MATPDVTPEVKPPQGAVKPPEGVQPITPGESADVVNARARAAAQLPPLSIDSVEYAKANFYRMDSDGDGFVSGDELDGYIKANKKNFKDGEQQVVDTLKANMHKLETANEDESNLGDDNDGFTRKDLATVKTDATASTSGPRAYDLSGGDLRPALDYANKNFKKMDADSNGFIDKTEITKYMSETELSSTEVRMLRNLSERTDTLSTSNNDGAGTEAKGLSAKDLSAANSDINNLTFAVENFSELDGNGDGFITKSEITGYERARGDITGQEAAALDFLRKKADTIQTLSDDEDSWVGDSKGMTGFDLTAALDAYGSANARGQSKLAAPGEVVASTNPRETETDKDPDKNKPKGNETDDGVARTHTVNQGENLWKICAEELSSKNGGKHPTNLEILGAIQAVKNANPTVDLSTIYPRQEIKIPKDLSCPVERNDNPPAPRAVPRPVPAPAPREQREPVPPPVPAPRHEPAPPREPVNPRDEHKPEPEKSDPDVLREHWRSIDRSGDNRVSREEIQDFVRNNQRNLTMKEITALGRMAAREGKIQELVNDERGDENSGISRADLQKAEQLQTAAQYLLRRDVMDRLNLNGDRFVDKQELEYALRTQNMRPQDRAMLNYLRSNYAKFQEGANNERGDENSGVSIQDLQYYAGLV